MLIVLFLFGFSGCRDEPAPGPNVQRHAREIMGTFAEVTAVAEDEETARAALEAAYDALEKVNRLMSDYLAESEVSRLNALPAGESMRVSHETFFVLYKGQEVARLSGGAFDMTCRPLVALWKRAGERGKLPTDAELAETLASVGWEKLALDPVTRSVSKSVDGLEIDLGGIAKGYALDLAAEAMRYAGATAGLIDVGGDVLAIGVRENGQPWKVGVRHPFEEGLIMKLTLSDRAVATSGLQQRFSIIEGKKYSHIVDPRTGRPCEQASAVSVIAADGMTADAWATVLSVLTVEEGQKLQADLDGIAVAWFDDRAPIAQQTLMSQDFTGYVAQEE